MSRDAPRGASRLRQCSPAPGVPRERLRDRTSRTRPPEAQVPQAPHLRRRGPVGPARDRDRRGGGRHHRHPAQGHLHHRPVGGLLHVRADHRRGVRADRARLHDGLRHPAAHQLRARRHHHGRRLQRLLPRLVARPGRDPRRLPAAGHACDHGARDGGVRGHRADRRAHLLPPVPSREDPGAADLRDRRLVLPPARVPRHVRIDHPFIPGPGVDEGHRRPARLRDPAGAADRDRDRARLDAVPLPHRAEDPDGHRDAGGVGGS